MGMLRVENYDDLTRACVQSKSEYQMLCIFMGLDELVPERGGGDVATAYVHILHKTNIPAHQCMPFSAVRNYADAYSPNWNFVVVGLVSNPDRSLPNAQQTHSYMADMQMRILNGFIDGFAVLDRNGDVVDVQAAVEAFDVPSTLN